MSGFFLRFKPYKSQYSSPEPEVFQPYLYTNDEISYCFVAIMPLKPSVLKRTAVVTNGESVVTLQLPSTIQNGIYVLQITNASGDAKTKSLVIEK